MRFLIETPQSVRGYLAREEARRASRRTSAQGSNLEPSTKKQKLLHGSLPPAPAQAQAHATTHSRLTEERSQIVYSSLPPAQAQVNALTDLRPGIEKQKAGHHSISPAQGNDLANHILATQTPDIDRGSLPPDLAHGSAQAHDITDLGPATKRQNLSHASLPPGRARPTSAERARAEAEYNLWRWWRAQGCDYNSVDQSGLSDTLLVSHNFDVGNYLAVQSSKVHPCACGPPKLDPYPFDASSAENCSAETPKVDAHHVPEQEMRDLSHLSPALDTAVRLPPVSGDVSLHYPLALGPVREHPDSASSDSGMGHNNTSSSPDQFASAGLNRDMGDNITAVSSNQIAFVASNCDLGDNTTAASSNHVNSFTSNGRMGDDTIAARSDQNVLSPSDSNLRDDNTPASSSRTPSVGPIRNQGGRPKGRKPRAPKIPKGRTRFQKNHPVKARVNMDVWENILLFCPPDFLLKARAISTTFRSVLKDDSLLWKRARINHFGSDMPDPPAGLSEPQYLDLLTGSGCQTRGCVSKKARKTYWALQKRLCTDCFQKAFLPPKALKRVFKELQTSGTPQYRQIALLCRSMDNYLPGMRFDRWNNYQWLGNYGLTPSWGQFYRSGQYTAYPAAACAKFSSELAAFMGNEYDVEQGRFSSYQPLPGKTCPPQEAIDAWFAAKRHFNDALVPKLQAVENWYECYKRENQKAAKDLRKTRETFYEEQAELAGLEKEGLKYLKSYRAAIAISKPVSMQSWRILLPKIRVEYEVARKANAAEEEMESERKAEMEADRVLGPVEGYGPLEGHQIRNDTQHQEEESRTQ